MEAGHGSVVPLEGKLRCCADYRSHRRCSTRYVTHTHTTAIQKVFTNSQIHKYKYTTKVQIHK